jgi:hypothetical protein
MRTGPRIEMDEVWLNYLAVVVAAVWALFYEDNRGAGGCSGV